MEQVVTLARESLDPLVGLEILEADITPPKAEVSVSLQENHRLYIPKVLILIVPCRFVISRQSMVILC